MGLMGISIIVIIYLLTVGYLGYLGWRRTKDTKDYLIAGGSIHPYIMAISYGATFISTSAIVGFGGAAAVFGMGLLWLTFLNIFVGIFIAFVFFGARTRKLGHNLGAHTFPELLSKRYDSKFIQIFSGSAIFVFMPLYASVVMMGAARFLETQLKIQYEVALLVFAIIIAAYVIMGGLKGVMYADALQGSIMFVGMVILLIITYNKLGGFIEAHKSLSALAIPEKLAEGGHQGWTSMPKGGSPLWWTLVSTIIMGVGIGVLAQPQLVVRFMTVKSKRELNRAVLVGGIFIFMMTGVAFIVGSLSNAYFVNNPEIGTISIAAAKGEVGKVIPLYIKHAMPSWFGIVFMLTLLSAAMSTLSSQFHAMGTSIGRDVFEQVNKKQSGSSFVTKVGIALAIIVATFLAWLLPAVFGNKGIAIIARGTAIFFGMCAATFLPAYFSAIYWKKATRAAAISSIIAGFLSSVFCLVFLHKSESTAIGLCKLIFGSDVLIDKHPWPVVDPIFIALPISIIVIVAVTYFTKPLEKQHVDKCFKEVN